MSLLGYTQDDVLHMIESLEIAYEIIDVPTDVDKGVEKAISLLTGLVAQGRV